MANMDEATKKDSSGGEKFYGEQNVLEKMDKLESEYDIYAAECKAGLQKVLLVTQNLYDAINRSGERNPIDRFESRIKTFKSVKGKCRLRGYEMTMESVRRNVKDIAGIRIITKYIDEVMVVKEAISRMSGIYIANIKDYVSKPKPNGYRSVHLDCQVEVYDPYKGYILVPVEIQIRSKSMNLWATLEHDLKYKNSNPSPDVEEKFKKIAKILEDFDQEAIALRDYSGPHNNGSANTSQ